MKRIFTVLLISICSLTWVNASAQATWAPEGAVWHYSFYGGWGVYISYMTMTVVGDTVLQGKECSVLNLVGPGDSIPYYDQTFYTYESNDTVWVYDGTNFRVLYNFNVSPGDTFETYGPQFNWCYDSTTTVVVDSVNYETVNGVLLKYLIVRTPEPEWGFQNCTYFGETYKILQKIGCLKYMFPQKICGADMPAICDLRCYEDPEFGFFTTNVADSCTYQLGVGIEEIDFNNVVKVYPNPVTDQFTVELKENNPDGILSVYSIDGRQIMEIKLKDKTTNINFSQAVKGCYVLKFELGDKVYQGRVVKL